MNRLIIVFLLIVAQVALADSLPSFSLQPANQTVFPGNTATFTVAASGATSYQWLFNGTNIPGATSATLQVANTQSTNSGYYNVIAKNATGWVPSQMAYLFLDYTFGGSQPTAGGVLPLSNITNIYFAGDVEAVMPLGGFSVIPTNGIVQIVAGPELDQMQPVGLVIHYRPPPFSSWFSNGYYNATRQIISTAKPGAFQNPRFAGTNFVSDLVGAAGRNYKVQRSTNLLAWSDLLTLLNISGTVTFTNPAASGPIFYSTVLLP